MDRTESGGSCTDSRAGSVGAIDYLSRELPEVYATAGTRRFSMVVRSQHEGDQVVGSEPVYPPRVHE
jgi:hypothetical protein